MMDKGPIMIKVGQVNLAGIYAAMAELEQAMKVRALDIVLVQEPYTYQDKTDSSRSPMGLESRKMVYNTQVVHPRTLVAHNNDCDFLIIQSLSNECFTTVQMSKGGAYVYFISCYFRWKNDDSIHLDFLQGILDKIGHRAVIIGGDFNARSKLWHSKETDGRGERLEDLITINGLSIVNRKDLYYTFSNTRGVSNIDLTLATEGLSGVVREWKVHPDVITSDHRLITHEVCLHRMDTREEVWVKALRHDLSRANTPKFEMLLEEVRVRLSSYLLIGRTDIDGFVESLTKEILECSDKAIPKKRIREPQGFELSKKALELKKAMVNTLHQARRAKSVSEDEKVLLRMTYKSTWKAFKKEVRNIKQQTFKRFVERYADDPWGPVYKTVTKKGLQPYLFSVIDVPRGEENIDIRDNIQTVMNTLFPDDDPTEDNETHRRMRADAFKDDEVFNPDDAPFTYEELICTVKNMKNKKSPGLDHISPEIMKMTVKVLESTYSALYNACMRCRYFPDSWKKQNWYYYVRSLEILILLSRTDRIASYRCCLKYWKACS